MQRTTQQTMQLIMRLIAVFLISIALPAQAGQLAGEVTAAMGEAQVVPAAGGEYAATQGMQLHVGDILQTGSGGHIHIRMIDDALVSLRPNSKLKIASYTYQPGVTATIQIRLDILHGTARSVTGKGGELAKDRFRMNTPIAAIGVRGTDFIVQADTENTRVHVASGAIVLAPFGAGCQANTLGACQTTAARVLTAEMRDTMLELTRSMTEPRFVPLGDKLKTIDPHAAAGSSGQQVRTQTPASAPDQVSADAGLQNRTPDNLAAPQLSVAAVPVPVPVPVPVVISVPVPVPVVISVPVPVPVVIPVLARYQMVWGRWLWDAQGSAIDIPYMEAAQGREITVGTASALFRDNSAPFSLPQSGRSEFILRQAQVSLPQTGGAIAGQVQNGTLGVDFGTNMFNTQLNILHPSLTGPVALNAVGTLRNGGMLHSTASSSNGTVAGSLSRDGAEAGYLFNLPTTAGTLTGTTLWIK